MEKTITKEGAADAPRRSGLTLHHETAHYRVVSGVMSGPADLPEEMRLKYIVQHKQDGVIYGVSGSLGSALIAALEAEKELSVATELLASEHVRQPGNGAPPNFAN